MTRAPRVLVALDPPMYRQVIAHAFRRSRPRAEVSTAEPADLDVEAERLAPHLVVCNRATAAVREAASSWVEIEVRFGAGDLGAIVKVDGLPTSRVEPAQMSDVLSALDRTEKTLRPA